MNLWTKLHAALLDLMFPRQCVGCKVNDTWLCDHCFLLIKKSDQYCCYVCRKPHPEAKTCPEHQSERTLDRLFVSAHYSGNPLLATAIHEMKYNRHPEDIGNKLGKLMSESLQTPNSEPLTLIPVPLHPTRLKERGFNQAQILANALSAHSKLRSANASAVADPNSSLLTRSKYTTSQVKSGDRESRLENLKDAFAVTEPVDPNATYLLIDDVATTGSTLEECCQALRTAGAKQVWGLVVARN